MNIERTQIEDAEQILSIQKLADISEAEIYNNYNIPPLTQTLDELIKEFSQKFFYKAIFNEKIIGSVNAYTKDATTYIGRLIVLPEYQGNGIGSKLPKYVEENTPNTQISNYLRETKVQKIYHSIKCVDTQ